MVRQLRKGAGNFGLVLANGGYMSYHHAVCLSRGPREDGSQYPNRNPLPQHVSDDHPVIAEEAEGRARIEVSIAIMIALLLVISCSNIMV